MDIFAAQRSAMLLKKSLLLLVILQSITTLSIQAQYDTLRMMYYNTLDFPASGDPGRDLHFRTIQQYVQADVILVNELSNETGADLILNNALNVFGTTSYQRAAFTNGPTTNNMLFFNSEKLALYSQWYIITPLRYINEYVLFYKPDGPFPDGDTTFLYFYVAHLKANPEDSLQRLAEVNAFRQRLDNLPNAENIFFGGDLNLYTSSEPAYQALVNTGYYTLNDPLPAGNWHSNSNFSHIHTQSTRTVSFGGGAIGGMDDRFDFILFSDDVITGENGVRYIDNTCIAFGNDGTRFNGSLIDLPLNPNIPDSVTYALYYMSDHLPVICDIRVDHPVLFSGPNLVITEIMYDPPGADYLEYIEIYNNSNFPANLQGYYFSDGIGYTFPDTLVQPGDFIVVARFKEQMADFFGFETLEWTGGSLFNGGELIRLKDSTCNTVDSVFYQISAPWPVEPNGQGPSLVLCDPDFDNSLGGNWAASNHFAGFDASGNPVYGTPGFTECLYPPLAYFMVDTVEINVGETVKFTDLSANEPISWYWEFSGGLPATSDLQNPTIYYPAPGFFDVELTVTNQAGSNSFVFENYITVIDPFEGYLMITEIMKDPHAVPDSLGEWFEVYNPSSSDIDMLGWFIWDNDFDSIVVTSSLVVPANGFAVLGNNANPATNGGFICDYQYSGFYLGNNDDEIILARPDGIEVNRVEYDNGTNWPNPTGSSLVFTGTPDDNNNDFTFWTTATQREPSYTGTTGDKGSPGTNGFQQNLINHMFYVNLRVLLQGPFNVNSMVSLPESVIPLEQPYHTSPWNYPGTESVGSIPGDQVVDWVLVELRDAATAAAATQQTTIARKACFILSNGHIVDSDGISPIQFEVPVNQQLFAVVRHRNHLSIMSSDPVQKSGSFYTYDFTDGQTKAYQQGQVMVASGLYAMVAGDADASGIVNLSDKNNYWELTAGEQGYLPFDFNFDAEVNNPDKNEFWFPNFGAGTKVPE
jgi:PKD repeat protein